MKKIIAQKLDKNNVKFEYFYYSFCKKNPNELVFSQVDEWEEIDEKLREIFQDQLVHIVNSKNKNYEGVTSDNLLEIDKGIKLPEGIDFPKDEKVLNIFGEVIKDNLTIAEMKELGDKLSLKYLTAKYSRPCVYGLLTFQVEIEQQMQRFTFITLCDLELEHENLRVDEDGKKLVSEIIKNVFSERKLTKGVLYPYVRSEAEKEALLLYEDENNQTLYWSDAFECRRRLPKKDEQKARNQLISDYFTRDNQVYLDEYGAFLEGISALKEAAISDVNCGAVLKEVNQSIDNEKFKKEWKDTLKLEGFTLNRDNLWHDKLDYTIAMGDEIKLKVTPKKIKNIRQFEHQGKTYLVVEENEVAKINGIPLPILGWEKFKKIIEKE